LLATASDVLAEETPWPTARALWLARIDRAANFFLRADARYGGVAVSLEKQGRLRVEPLDFTLFGTPDRIDRLPDGRLHLIDYKTGSPPSEKQQATFDKQLLLAAAMAERGGFADLGPTEVGRISYVGLGNTPKEVETELSHETLDAVWEGLVRLMQHYDRVETGYTARRAMFSERQEGDYDHLSRLGEWEMTDLPQGVAIP
jgi:ATP-dependent helicase/nuclease subunit B